MRYTKPVYQQAQPQPASPARSSRSITPSRMKQSDTSSGYNIYAYVPQPQFDAKDYLVAEATERDIMIYKEIFDFLDCNNNGAIQPMDLRKAFMQQGGYNPEKALIYQIMSDFDTDESGIIEFKEFVKMMTMKPCTEDTVEDIANVYYHIDYDYKEYIDFQDLKELSKNVNDNSSDDQIKEMMRLCDPDGNGVIRKEHFIKFMKRNS